MVSLIWFIGCVFSAFLLGGGLVVLGVLLGCKLALVQNNKSFSILGNDAADEIEENTR